MEKGQKVKIFNQFYLSQLPNLDITTISKYEKVQAFTKGCSLRRNKHLYQNLRAFTDDLQTILSYDPESANIVFQQYKQIRFHYNESNKEDSRVKVQCRRCGQYTPPFKYCPKCQDVHYCSEVCEINIKLTHEKQECKIKSYPKTHHPILVEVHFGSNLGQNIQIYFQHQARAYGLVRGKQIIKQLYQFFIGIKKTANSELRDTSRRTKIEQKLTKYKLELKNNEKYLQFQLRNEKDYPTGILKVDLQDMDALKRIYEQNQLLEQIQLYLLEQGSLMIECAEEIHNNHVHYVYIFRIP